LLDSGDAGGREDRRDHEHPCPALGADRAQQKGCAEWNRGAGIAEVVDQVREQGDAATGDEDCELSARREGEDRQGQANRPQSLS
jgi:hypothetical protein